MRVSILFISLFIISLIPSSTAICIAQDTDAQYQWFHLKVDVEKEHHAGKDWPYELVESPFYIRVTTTKIYKRIQDFRTFPKESFEFFIYKYTSALLEKNENFLKERSLYNDNPRTFTAHTGLVRNFSSMNNVLKYRFDIDDSILAQVESTKSKRMTTDRIVKEGDDFKWSLADDTGALGYLLQNASPITKDRVIQKKFELEVPLGDQLPVTNKVFLAFDASTIDQTINIDSPKRDELVKQPKLLLYQDLVRAIHTKDTKRLGEITTWDTCSNFIDEMKLNLNNGYSIYERPILEAKRFRLEIANNKVTFLFYQTETMSRTGEYKVLMLKKVGSDWKITNYHGGLFMEQLLSNPLVQKQVLSLF